jgi:hypothetical protein
MTTVRFVENGKVCVRVFAWFGPGPHGDPQMDSAVLCDTEDMTRFDSHDEGVLAEKIYKRMQRRYQWNSLLTKINPFTKKRTV